jgi:outer membrane protein OmpA-like peptidoglycan-associated protein
VVIMKWFEELIIKSSREKYSDIHITGRQPRVSRKNGKLHIDRTYRCNGKKIDEIVMNLSNPLHLEMLKKRQYVDVTTEAKHIRINIHITSEGLSLSIYFTPNAGTISRKLEIEEKPPSSVPNVFILNALREFRPWFAKAAIVVMLFVCLGSCSLWDKYVMRKQPEKSGAGISPTEPYNKDVTPGKTIRSQEMVVPSIYGYEYGGTFKVTSKGQMFVMNEKEGVDVLPLLPGLAKRFTVALAVRTTEGNTEKTRSIQEPEHSASERVSGVVEEEARNIKQCNEISAPQKEKDCEAKRVASPPVQTDAARSVVVPVFGKAVIYFHANQYRLTKNEKEQINHFILPYMKKDSGDNLKVVVRGFIHSSGTKNKNDDRAMARAKAVAEYLEQNGIKVWAVKGEGDNGYISKFSNINRRVEIEAFETKFKGEGDK